MSKAYLGIGSNLGDKKENIEKSIELLNNHSKINVSKVSSYYETEPVGYENQDWFLNIAVEIDTSLEPYGLLAYCQKIEQQLKRKRLIRWGPRTIDLDVLLYENFVSNDEKLILPHPRMHERAFVMIPLYEIAKNISINNKKISDIVENLSHKGIRQMDSSGEKV